MGLSLTLFNSRPSNWCTQVRESRAAPMTCGAQRIEYGSCTIRPSSLPWSTIWLPARAVRMAAAEAIWPGWCLSVWAKGGKGLGATEQHFGAQCRGSLAGLKGSGEASGDNGTESGHDRCTVHDCQ